MKQYIAYIIPYAVVGLISCRKFINIPPPPTELVEQNVFTTDATVESLISEVYGQLSGEFGFATSVSESISLFEGIYADELVSYVDANSNSPFPALYVNNVTSTNSIVFSTWSESYSIIYSVNRIIEGLNATSTVSSPIKRQILGESMFLRAFCHFYLVNLYGDVPLILNTNYRDNAIIARTQGALVYKSIVEDLLNAKELLSDDYPSAGRARVNKASAIAFLSRVFLYLGDYNKAEENSTTIINQSNKYSLHANLDSVFLVASQEAIWQLLPRGGINKFTYEGEAFILVAAPTFVALKDALVESFEIADKRYVNWVNSLTSNTGLTRWYFPYKYKEKNIMDGTGSEAATVLRLAEQYLIRAEARVYQGKLTGANSAETDINIIRNRAGLNNTIATNKAALLDAIKNERKVELFTEWGHRFFDLKRWQQLDQTLGAIKPNWNSTDSLLPIPQAEILINTQLTQNKGY